MQIPDQGAADVDGIGRVIVSHVVVEGRAGRRGIRELLAAWAEGFDGRAFVAGGEDGAGDVSVGVGMNGRGMGLTSRRMRCRSGGLGGRAWTGR
jgi:hypothetical protein